ncbi:MAG: hypothetical protein V4857_02815 [Pseudomonadota bacterium]
MRRPALLLIALLLSAKLATAGHLDEAIKAEMERRHMPGASTDYTDEDRWQVGRQNPGEQSG